MEHVLIGGNELFMTAGGKKNYTVEDIERLPEGGGSTGSSILCCIPFPQRLRQGFTRIWCWISGNTGEDCLVFVG